LKYKAPALSRGLEILELLSLKKTPLTLNQIAEELNVNTNQIFRLVYVLVESNYIERKNSDSFVISSKLFSLGMQFITNYSFLDIVVPFLKEISLKTNQSCHCSVKINDKMVVIAKADSQNSFIFSIRVGHSNDLDKSTSGKVILANLPKAEQSKFLKKLKDEYSEKEYISLLSQLKDIKTKKYHIAPSVFVEGIYDISVPVISKTSHLGIFCIVVPFVNCTDSTLNKEEVLEVLQESSKKISKIMI